jgi:light-regulated signal transduction histidine kinase (bacteriophytochrome)
MLDTKPAGSKGDGADAPYAKLHAPGEIQGFGVLLTLHPTTLRVLNASDNGSSIFGAVQGGLLGRTLSDIISDQDVIAEVKSKLTDKEPVFENPMLVTVNGQRCDLIMHWADGLVFAEFEPLAPGAPTKADMDRLSDEAIVGMMVPGTFDQLIEVAPAAIRQATGFDRVLLYRFDDSYRGQVIGEARRDGVDSFQGMFFPEADIGAPARQLYLNSFCRYIPRIDATPSRIVPPENPLTNKPLDMSGSVMRGVAPCHIAYLYNLGVTASMSFSIVSEGKLWGLFACHHHSPSQLSYTQRQVCGQIAMMFVAKLEEVIDPAAVREEMEQRRAAVLAATPLIRGKALQHQWTPEEERGLLTLVNADAAAIYVDGEIGEIGSTPDFGELHDYIKNNPDAFDGLLRMYDDKGLFYTSSIASVLPFGERMRERGSGVMIVPLSRTRREFLMWFRPEQVIKATWAGNPAETQKHVKDPNARYSPRNSFAAWKEDIRDRSEPWTALEIANAVALRDKVLATAA